MHFYSSASDTRYDRKVAIKKCNNAFDDVIDGKRILREIKLLQHFRHENVISILDMIPPSNVSKYKDVYMVLSYMESDLHKIIYSRNKLTDQHFQYFTYQILRGLKYIHACGVIHRDLKPSNLLVNSNCDLKICDFGLARSLSWDFELTEYVVTRWYRAPEIMCSCQDYDEKIDVWSVGCILAEMVRRKPLFPGDHYISQLNLIFALIGVPKDDTDLECVGNVKALQYIKKLKPQQPKNFKEYFNGASDLCIDFIKGCLQFNPKKRLSVQQALEHPYLKAIHDPKKLVECERSVDFAFEMKCKDRKGLKEEMYQASIQIRERSNKQYQQYLSNKTKQEPSNLNSKNINDNNINNSNQATKMEA